MSVFGGLVLLSFLGGTLAFWSKLMQRWFLLKLYYLVDSLNHSHLRFLCQLTNQNNQGNKFHSQRAPYAPTWFQGRTSARISKSSSLRRRKKKQTCFFFQPQEKKQTCYVIMQFMIYLYMYIIYVGDWLSILLSSIYYQQLPMKSSEKMLLEVLLPKKIFSGGSWWSKFPRLIWGKRSLDLYYRCFRNPAKKCSS